MPRKVIIALLAPLLLLCLPLVVNFGKTGKQTTVLNRDFSLLKKPEILSHLPQEFPLPESVLLVSEGRQFVIPTASFSAQYNYSQVASNLLFRRLHQGLRQYLLAFFQPKDFPLVLTYNSTQLDNVLTQISSQIDRPFIPLEIVYDGNQPLAKDGQLGQATDLSRLTSLIVDSLISYRSTPIVVPQDTVGSLPNPEKIDQVLLLSQKLLHKSLKLTYVDQSAVLEDKALVSWLGFDSPCLEDKISDYVVTLAQSVKKDPVDALLNFDHGQVTEFRPAQDGYAINTDQLQNLLCPRIQELIASKDNQLTLEIPLYFTAPKISNSQANSLGIKELLGRGASTFRHSSAIRNQNVERGAAAVNRVLVAPGETFSFLKALGEVSLESGYKMAYIIRQGKTELDVGGGICQVSTTFFRAMLNAGLDITERKNHAYRVQYYEEDMPPGYDATVFIPSPDLKFVNDTGHHLLIQSLYDGKLKKLTYEIYGTSDGRQVDISNYRQWGYAPPPPDVYIDDPSLPPGKVIKDESRIPGLKTAFDWQVTRQGEVIHRKTFQSVFVPWAAVYRRGPSL